VERVEGSRLSLLTFRFQSALSSNLKKLKLDPPLYPQCSLSSQALTSKICARLESTIVRFRGFGKQMVLQCERRQL
jgi:hypothetical protein